MNTLNTLPVWKELPRGMAVASFVRMENGDLDCRVTDGHFMEVSEELLYTGDWNECLIAMDRKASVCLVPVARSCSGSWIYEVIRPRNGVFK